MAAGAALLWLCFGALSPCPSGADPLCFAQVARGLRYPKRMGLSHDDVLVAVAGDISGLYVYNVITGAVLTVPSYNGAHDVALSPHGDTVAVAVRLVGVARVECSGTQLGSDASREIAPVLRTHLTARCCFRAR